MTVSNSRWQKVRDWIVHQIESGEWPAQTKLPSIRALSQMFNTSISTVQRAFMDLEANAYIRTVPRVGHFVLASGQGSRTNAFDFSSVTVKVNHEVVAMLAQAAQHPTQSLSSAVLQGELTPHTLLTKCLTAVASKADSALTGLVAPPGLPALRRRIAGLMLARGVVCGPDEVLITSGDSIAMELALEAIAPKGATIAIETPTYYGILQIIERLGMHALPIQTDAVTGMNLDHLAEALKQKAVAAIFLNPTLQNPRGFIMPEAARARLSELAVQADVPIIEDDIFFDLVPETARPRAIKSYAIGEKTIYCSSFSKTIAPGYRVGWCVPGSYREAILAQLFSRNLSVSSLAQHVMDEFIARGYMTQHGIKLRAQLCVMTTKLAALVRTDFPAGTRYIPPSGGFIHWIELPEHTDMLLLAKLADEKDCSIMGSSLFFADGRASTGLRLCLGTVLSSQVVQQLKTLALCVRQAVV